MDISQAEIDEVVRNALLEDRADADITTETLVPADLQSAACIIPKAEGVLAGVEVAKAVFRAVDPELEFQAILLDGARLRVADSTGESGAIAELSGSVASILKGERVALNFLQHLSGIATETDRYVREVTDYDAVILDTRKTAPGLRSLQKYAVAVGGGTNHRRDLSDGVLIKDNHLAAGRLSELALGGVVRRMRESAPSAWEIEVEIETLDQLHEAVEAGADIVMLDNMTPSEMAEAVRIVDGQALTEASGGITLDNVKEVAATGVDRISVGALTHSVTGLDISLELLDMG
ncbi:MAG: carboxylating nicotinate-nucleotide diphosphorylase [Dehalococcoidia bacterium]|nr:carboxylating nicotinate-nucleotide diphosphorylase [Dehalococcoidia bacterium]